MKLVSNMLSFAVLGALGEERLPATRTLDLGSGRARLRYKHEAGSPRPEVLLPRARAETQQAGWASTRSLACVQVSVVPRSVLLF